MNKIFLVITVILFSSITFAQEITVTDITGRQVTLKAPAKRIILGEGRSLITLSLFYKDPTSVVVGWTGDFKKHGGLLYDEYEKVFPGIKNIKNIGATGKETVSTEQIIALKPDLAIFGAGSHGPDAKSANVIKQLTAAGIPIVFVDFRLHPLKNTVPSMDILGKVLGKESIAKSFNELYTQKLNFIKQTVAKNKTAAKPKVYMEMIRGELSGTPGKGNMGEYIEFVGGKNIGDILPGEVGELNAEYVITQQPDIYIATGLALPGEKGFVIGHGITSAQTQISLKALIQRPLMTPLKSIKNNKVYGLWHFFYDSPLNIIALEALAKWINPALFSSLNPQTTINTLNSKFLAIPLKGVYYTELKK